MIWYVNLAMGWLLFPITVYCATHTALLALILQQTVLHALGWVTTHPISLLPTSHVW